MKSLKSTNEKTNFILLFLIAVLFGLFSMQGKQASASENYPGLWEIQSIDTMKTSRDMARAKLNNPGFDTEIEKEIIAIKSMGANYVAIGTPYDSEFLPFLKRWLKLARKHELKVWFRGNFSNWEGWFEYPKNLSPENHNIKTAQFIKSNPDLFEDGDIFDPCPECENAGHFKQPERDKEFNQFISNQKLVLEDAFKKINKKVRANIFSIIGGRAKEVLYKQTADNLENVVTIDHYVKDAESYNEYIDYFKRELNSKTMLGEFGAPIPDLHGNMDELSQADFIESILSKLYVKKNNVAGLNYNVLSLGSSSLLNEDGSPRLAVSTIKKYFAPAILKGNIKNPLGENLKDIEVKTTYAQNSTFTDDKGNYTLKVPTSDLEISAGNERYKETKDKLSVISGQESIKDFTLEPKNKDFIYWLKEILQYFMKNITPYSMPKE